PFHSYRHHPDLHSFPTRRSSDLAGRRHGEGAHHRRPTAPRDPARAVHAGRHRHGDRTVKNDSVDTKTLMEWSAKYHTPNYVPMPDRKSTRLNSSHRTISYAVFCL